MKHSASKEDETKVFISALPRIKFTWNYAVKRGSTDINEVWTSQERLLTEWQSLQLEQDMAGLFMKLWK